jgi:hypothetical protein
VSGHSTSDPDPASQNNADPDPLPCKIQGTMPVWVNSDCQNKQFYDVPSTIKVSPINYTDSSQTTVNRDISTVPYSMMSRYRYSITTVNCDTSTGTVRKELLNLRKFEWQ